MRSSRRWITNVGTWIVGSTARTSISLTIVTIRRNALGVTDIRSNRANSRRAWLDSARLGKNQSMVAPWPQRCCAISVSDANIASDPSPQG
jgi:hypothetical protein